MTVSTALYNFFKSNLSFIAALMSVTLFFVQIIINPLGFIIPKLVVLIATEFPAVGPVALSAYGFVNYFVPLNELAGLVIVYVPIYLLVVAIRMIKSFIPFIN